MVRSWCRRDARTASIMLSAILSGSLCLVPQLTLSGRVAVPAAVPVAVRRLAVSPQAALTTDEKIVPRDVLLGTLNLTTDH